MALPKEKRQPKRRIEEYTHLIFGPPKIGKTTFCSQMDNPIFLATEAGTNALEVYEVPITGWTEFLETAAELAKGDHPFKTVVIDTADNLWKFCSDYICKKMKITHESDLEWGKGWSLVRDEFLRAVTKLSLLPYGLVFISHADEKEFKTRTGTITKSVCSLPKGGREVLLGMVDIILFATSELTKDGERRLLRTQASENYEAGGRISLPDPLPLDFPTYRKAFEAALLAQANGKVRQEVLV